MHLRGLLSLAAHLISSKAQGQVFQIALTKVGWAFIHQQAIKRMPTNMLIDQYDEGSSSVEVPFSHLITKIHQHILY